MVVRMDEILCRRNPNISRVDSILFLTELKSALLYWTPDWTDDDVVPHVPTKTPLVLSHGPVKPAYGSSSIRYN